MNFFGQKKKGKNMPISQPRNFRQLTHIGYNKNTGEFEVVCWSCGVVWGLGFVGFFFFFFGERKGLISRIYF
jgi:hypothetical protein